MFTISLWRLRCDLTGAGCFVVLQKAVFFSSLFVGLRSGSELAKPAADLRRSSAAFENHKRFEAASTMALYLVSTPIGNLEDITLRALRVLKEVNLIACEDTRHTRRLLDHFGINKPTISYHEHNEQARAEELVMFMIADGRLVD